MPAAELFTILPIIGQVSRGGVSCNPSLVIKLVNFLIASELKARPKTGLSFARDGSIRGVKGAGVNFALMQLRAYQCALTNARLHSFLPTTRSPSPNHSRLMGRAPGYAAQSLPVDGPGRRATPPNRSRLMGRAAGQ